MARDGRWGCCSPAATPPIRQISAQCYRPSASATGDPDGLARDPIGCLRIRPTPPLPTAGSSPSAESRSPSPSARTRRPAEFDAAQPADGHAALTPRPTRAATSSSDASTSSSSGAGSPPVSTRQHGPTSPGSPWLRPSSGQDDCVYQHALVRLHSDNPIIAARHSQHVGMLRYFAVTYTDDGSRAVPSLSRDNPADGTVVY